jgi:hypothetical protein
LEVKNLMASCGISKQLQASQELLASATYLADIVPVCLDVGLDIADDAQQTLAEVLWDQGEHSTSVRMLQQLATRSSTVDNASHCPRAVVLAHLVRNLCWHLFLNSMMLIDYRDTMLPKHASSSLRTSSTIIFDLPWKS